MSRSTGSRHASSVVVAHEPSLSSACGILPEQGLHPGPCVAGRFSTTGPYQGSPRRRHRSSLTGFPSRSASPRGTFPPKVLGVQRSTIFWLCSYLYKGLRLLLAHGGQFQWLLLLLSLTATLSPVPPPPSLPTAVTTTVSAAIIIIYSFFFFKQLFTEVWLVHSVSHQSQVYSEGIQLYVHMVVFFRFFSIVGYYKD